MTSSKFFKSWNLGFKLNAILILALVVLLVAMLVILESGLRNLTLRTGQQGAEEETLVIQSRFEEAERDILIATKLLATRPGLLEAVVNRDANATRTLALAGAGTLQFDEVDVVDADGAGFTTVSPDVINVTAEDELLSLALLGIETTGVITEKAGAEQGFLLAAVVPLRDTSGAIVGALLAGREVDDEFLSAINFSRDNVQLALIHNGQIVAQSLTSPPEQQTATEFSESSDVVGRVLDETVLEQALSGQTVTAQDLVYLADEEPHALTYTPLTIGDDPQTALAVFFKVSQLSAFQRQLTSNMVIMFTLLTVLTVIAVAWALWKSVTAPIGKLKSVAEQITDGDYSQQAPVTSTDEIGQLANAFNGMTSQLRQLIGSLEQRVLDRTRRLEILATMGANLNAARNQDALLAEVVNQVKDNFGYYHAHIYLLDDDSDTLIVAEGTGPAGADMKRSGHSIPLNTPASLVAQAASSSKIVKVDDVRQAENWLPNPLLPDTHAEMAVPITIGAEGKVIGVLDVQENKVGGLDEGDANLLRSLANSVAVALINARLFEQTIQAKQEAERAREETDNANKAMEIQVWQTTGQARLSDRMRGGQDISTLANNIIHQLCHYLQAQLGALYVVEDDRLNLVGRYAYRSKNGSNSFKFGEGLVGQAALEKSPLVINEVPDDYITISSGLGETVPKTIMVFPFIYEDQVVGVVELATLTEFSSTQLEFIQTALTGIAIAFSTAQTRARVDELLTQTQRQTEELQAQSEELQATNEELETQTESLRISEAKLREKQAELEETNTQLEEKASALEESTTALREKQATLDRHNQELKVAQQDLKQQAEELALASKYKSEFLANMSHELRTPLNSLLILARMLTENKQGNLTEEQIESTQIIYNGGQDLLNLINDILDLSKVESGKMTFTFEAMPLTDLTMMVQTQFAHVAEEKGLDLSVTLADDLPPSISTDEQRVKQIIKNLVSNAFKFTTEGSVSLNIYQPNDEADLSRSGLDPSQTVAISVVDTGIGMTPDQQKVIFEAFQQADGSTSRQYGGTGLGLSISRELAVKLGGQINVSSKAGQGSTFTLYLPGDGQINENKEEPRAPIIKPIPPQTPKPPVPPPAAAPTLSLPSFPDDRAEVNEGDKILLVIEDDPKFAKVVYNFSHEKGFKCLVAPDGQTGLALIKNHTPTAIILDLHLPDTSGWDVLDVLKNDPVTRHIPVHIMSVDEEVLDAYRKGAMGYLTKPANSAALGESFESIEQFLSKEIKDLLLVEDDANARHSIKMLLGGSDVRISEAERGQAALDLLQAQHFDCMILDLTLPDMNGFEVLSQMNGNGTKAKCPVIVYTGQDLTPEENDELMKYADSVIVKGVKSPERLLDETALFLHRVVADMPVDKQETIKQLYHEDGLFTDKKILIVDDDVRNSFALSKLLTDRGLAVRIARDGQQALESLAKDPAVDLVLMDIMMPVMDGYETIRNIRALPEFKALPILALTAKAMKGDREKCLAAGANDYLPKPIDIDRLFSMLRVWLYQ